MTERRSSAYSYNTSSSFNGTIRLPSLPSLNVTRSQSNASLGPTFSPQFGILQPNNIATPTARMLNQQTQHATAAAQHQASMPARQNSFSSTYSLPNSASSRIEGQGIPKLASFGSREWTTPRLSAGKIQAPPTVFSGAMQPATMPASTGTYAPTFVTPRPASITQFRFGADFPFQEEDEDDTGAAGTAKAPLLARSTDNRAPNARGRSSSTRRVHSVNTSPTLQPMPVARTPSRSASRKRAKVHPLPQASPSDACEASHSRSPGGADGGANLKCTSSGVDNMANNAEEMDDQVADDSLARTAPEALVGEKDDGAGATKSIASERVAEIPSERSSRQSAVEQTPGSRATSGRQSQVPVEHLSLQDAERASDGTPAIQTGMSAMSFAEVFQPGSPLSYLPRSQDERMEIAARSSGSTSLPGLVAPDAIVPVGPDDDTLLKSAPISPGTPDCIALETDVDTDAVLREQKQKRASEQENEKDEQKQGNEGQEQVKEPQDTEHEDVREHDMQVATVEGDVDCEVDASDIKLDVADTQSDVAGVLLTASAPVVKPLQAKQGEPRPAANFPDADGEFVSVVSESTDPPQAFSLPSALHPPHAGQPPPRPPASGISEDMLFVFNSTYSYPYSVASSPYCPQAVPPYRPAFSSAPRSPLAPTAEDMPVDLPFTPPSGLQRPCSPTQPVTSAVSSSVYPIPESGHSPPVSDDMPPYGPPPLISHPYSHYHGHHVRHESYPLTQHAHPHYNDHARYPPLLGNSMPEQTRVHEHERRFSHKRNSSTASCPPQTNGGLLDRRHSAPNAVTEPTWLLAACEKGFRFVAQDIDGMVDVSQNKTALTLVFDQLGPEVVPMPKYDSWFSLVFQNFDEQGHGLIDYESFVEIVRQYFEHHAKYRRRRAQEPRKKVHSGPTSSGGKSASSAGPLSSKPPSSIAATLEDATQPVSSSGVAAEDVVETEVPVDPTAKEICPSSPCAIKEEPTRESKPPDEEESVVSKRDSEDFREGDVGSDGNEFLVSGPPMFPGSKCLIPDKGRVATTQSPVKPHAAAEAQEPSADSSDNAVVAKGTPIKLPMALEYPTYAGRLQIFDDYEFYNLAGKGAFGKVIVVRHKRSKALRACKTIPVQNDLHKSLIDNEIECLQRLNHPNILKLYETYAEAPSSTEDEFRTRNIYLIMEMCEGGDLITRMLNVYDGRRKKKLTENTVAHMVQQMLSGIAYCHAHDIIHRDLKPDNILFVDRSEDSDLKIIDFGLASFKEKIMASAKEVKIKRPGVLGVIARHLPFGNRSGKHIISHHVRRQVMQRAGTAHYMAPEMIRADYTEKCDIFSIGIIVYQLLTGVHPFYEHQDDEEKVRNKICSESSVEFTKAQWNSISKEAKDLTQKLLIKNPLKRPSAEEALSFKWLKDNSKALHIGRMEDISHSVFEGLRRYQGHNKLKKAVLQLLARELSEYQIQELRKKFLALDKTGTGFITREELMQGMKQSGLSMTDKEVLDIVKSLGDDHNGAIIGYNQFVGALIERVPFTRLQLEEVFQKLDTDKSGFITPAKLQAALTSQNITLPEVQEIWREVDPSKNPSAGISFDEFCSLFNFLDQEQKDESPKMAKI